MDIRGEEVGKSKMGKERQTYGGGWKLDYWWYTHRVNTEVIMYTQSIRCILYLNKIKSLWYNCDVAHKSRYFLKYGFLCIIFCLQKIHIVILILTAALRHFLSSPVWRGNRSRWWALLESGVRWSEKPVASWQDWWLRECLKPGRGFLSQIGTFQCGHAYRGI